MCIVGLCRVLHGEEQVEQAEWRSKAAAQVLSSGGEREFWKNKHLQSYQILLLSGAVYWQEKSLELHLFFLLLGLKSEFIFSLIYQSVCIHGDRLTRSLLGAKFCNKSLLVFVNC